MSKDMTFEVGNDNVFADLGFDNPEGELLKAKLVREISAIIKRRRLTQAKPVIGHLKKRRPDGAQPPQGCER
jgi:hypothetical protein